MLWCIEVVADAGVRTEAIRRGFDEDRALAGADLVDDFLHALVERNRIIAVELDALEAVTGGARCKVRSEEHTSELQSLMRISYAVFCLQKKTNNNIEETNNKYINTSTPHTE